jgi:AcrR family transcriptional regulator
MARAKSEEKRLSILSAATHVIAKQGTEAPTLLIARQAGIADGTLFTYFRSKDVLFNELYLHLKTELRDAMMPGYPLGASQRDRIFHTWHALVQWGIDNPEKRQAMHVLNLSERVSVTSKAAGADVFSFVMGLLKEIVESHQLLQVPVSFYAGLLGVMSESTMDYVCRGVDHPEAAIAAGFNAFWRAIGGD